ncbi:MAG TPA: prepilin-type N-terminal cleavage/methylation domain-containing protein [Phycisphaerae bacterium]|nr:prepilin-type N-terminal cleavage/methylation domain-containing protein [Phycisphaerae bacterium]
MVIGWPANSVGVAVRRRGPAAFTLLELLVVVAVIGLLISILLPSLSSARAQARAAKCLANLHVLGQGLALYAADYRDVLPPGRLPKIDDCNAYADILGGRKYRPTFTAMMSVAVNAPPFEDPKPCKTDWDRFGERGDRQNYSYAVYVCPSVPEWTDERNGSYGYNYQFLGNSRLFDDQVVDSYKNWPVQLTDIRYPGRTVATGDCMGTAAAYPPNDRQPYDVNERPPYEDDLKVAECYGNEGFNLDPPRIDLENGEIAGYNYVPPVRSAADPRHTGNANVLWVDGHANARTLQQLGYQFESDGSIGLDGENLQWSGNGLDVPWTPEFRP